MRQRGLNRVAGVSPVFVGTNSCKQQLRQNGDVGAEAAVVLATNGQRWGCFAGQKLFNRFF